MGKEGLTGDTSPRPPNFLARGDTTDLPSQTRREVSVLRCNHQGTTTPDLQLRGGGV